MRQRPQTDLCWTRGPRGGFRPPQEYRGYNGPFKEVAPLTATELRALAAANRATADTFRHGPEDPRSAGITRAMWIAFYEEKAAKLEARAAELDLHPTPLDEATAQVGRAFGR